MDVGLPDNYRTIGRVACGKRKFSTAVEELWNELLGIRDYLNRAEKK